MPIVYKATRLARLLNLPYFPVTANQFVFGPVLGLVVPLPAKFRIRVLPPVYFDAAPNQERYNRSQVMEYAEQIRAQIQEAVYEHAAEPSQRVVRLMRILVTGLGTFWGSKVAQRLENEPGVDLVVGVDTSEPVVPLERTEYVRTDSSFSILERIVRATKVDTILHTHLIVDSTKDSGRALHENNVIGTMNLLAAAGAAGSTIRKVVLRAPPWSTGPATTTRSSSGRRCAGVTHRRPAWSAPCSRRRRSSGTSRRTIPHVTVTKLDFANVLGDHVRHPWLAMLRLPVVPEVLGFDPRLQFVHEDDVIGGLAFATLRRRARGLQCGRRGHDPVERGLRHRREASAADASVPDRARRRAAPSAPPRSRSPRRLLPCCGTGAGWIRRVRASRVSVRLYDGGHRRRVRAGPTASDHRRAARVPLRAGRGELLPPLPRRGPRQRMT